jgi:putative transposase
MPQSLSGVFVHGVFSTKHRSPYLADPNIRANLHAYIAGISKNIHCAPVIVGGVDDHVHILALLHRTLSQSDWMKEIKKSSSLWMKQHAPEFAWQAGYGVFSVGKSQVETVKIYIANQEDHHRHGTFQEEFRALLEVHEIAWDEQYVWD